MIYSLKILAIFSSVLVAGGAVSSAAYVILKNSKSSYLLSLEHATAKLKTEITSSEQTITEQKALVEATKKLIAGEKADLESKTSAYQTLLTAEKSALDTQELATISCVISEASVESVPEETETATSTEELITEPDQSLPAPTIPEVKKEVFPKLADCLISEYLYSDFVSRRKESEKLSEKVTETKKALTEAKTKLIVKKQKSDIKSYWTQSTQQAPSHALVTKAESISFEEKINAARRAEREFSASKFLLQYSERVMEGQKTKHSTLVPAYISLQEIMHSSKSKHSALHASQVMIFKKEEEIKKAKEQIAINEPIIKKLKPATEIAEKSKPTVQ